ncbi:MAG: methyltransferase domain-containing protein, partial [Deltaproteobacteria bacterium]|nr:methyltransferase domain-containing protein [Deltaproteobacteria bacterium]
EARPLPVGLLQLLEFDDRDAVRNGRANQFRCLRKPSDDPANEDRFRRDSEALLAQRWWLAEETAWVRCFGRGRTFDTTDCSAYHVDNFRDVLVVDNPARDLSMSTRMILDALGAREGMRIVDVGAGMGYFTFKLAGTIGETGKVFALDTAPCAVRYIRTAMVGRGVSNVEVSLVSDTVVKFPFQDIDAFIFINTPCWSGNLSRRVYYLDMYRRMAAALRPGGKVVIWSAGRNISDAGIDPLDPREIAEAMKLADLHLVNSTSVAEYASEDTGTPFLLVLRKPGSD